MEDAACDIEAGVQSARYRFRRAFHERAARRFLNWPPHTKRRTPPEETVPNTTRCSTTTICTWQL